MTIKGSLLQRIATVKALSAIFGVKWLIFGILGYRSYQIWRTYWPL